MFFVLLDDVESMVRHYTYGQIVDQQTMNDLVNECEIVRAHCCFSHASALVMQDVELNG